MLNLTPHRRLHIPNGLAIIAAVLLLGASVAGNNPDQSDLASAHLTSIDENEITTVAKNIEDDIQVIRGSVKQNTHVLKLGMQLFQR